MIVVNVRVPALEKVYNFSVEEKAKVSDLIEELIELVAQKEGIPFGGDLDGMMLCSIENAEQCAKDKSLSDYAITGGTELLLV